MAAVDPADGSEDVSDFLRRIKELGDKRDREDEERSRQLEQDIIEGRKQREARRADRARSLSPEKSSPATTPRSMRSPRAFARSDLASSPLNASSTPSFSATIGSVMEETGSDADLSTSRPVLPPRPVSPVRLDSPTSQTLQSPPAPVQNAPAPARSTTLPWQQRPGSLRGPRPADLKEPYAASNASSVPAPAPAQEQDTESPALSRDQIAKSLGSKDPTWFRQTQDRGLGSAALRRNFQDTEPRPLIDAEKRELHGMSAGASSGASDMLDDEKASHEVPGNPQTIQNEPAAFEAITRTQPRPTSPTKGLGGFAQSAMLKRSESVTKRWSVQTPPSLNRQISDASTKPDPANGGFGSPVTTPKLIDDTSQPPSRSSSRPSSRPSSSHGNNLGYTATDTFVKPAAPQHKRSQSSLDTRSAIQNRSADQGTPSSPSKRWSPQKSSWLESALNRPESPTSKSPVPKYGAPQQPAWMVELSRAKQQRASRDVMDPTAHQPVEGFMSKPEDPKASLAPSRPSLASSPPTTKSKPASLKESPPLTSTKTMGRDDRVTAPADLVKSKPKPETPPKKDLRSQLRSSKPPQEKGTQQEPEFLNAFGKLKRTQTEKYVAPDELKDNILRGKSALAATDGPQKTQRRDELKESLVQQREAMKAKAADPALPKPQTPKSDATIPEAIAKKQALGRNESSGNILGSSKAGKGDEKPTTEAESPAPSAASDSTTVLQHTTSNSNLANKFNSGLASIIARGPPSSASSKPVPITSRTSPAVATPTSATRSETTGGEVAPGQLQHMTKGRARGPKRRLPNANSAAPQIQSEPTTIQSQIKPLKQSPSSSSKPQPPIKPRNITPSLTSSSLDGSPPEPQAGAGSKPRPPFKSPQPGISPRSPKPGTYTLASQTKSDTNASPLVKSMSGFSGRTLSSGPTPSKTSTETHEIKAKAESGLNSLRDISASLIGPSDKFTTPKPSPPVQSKAWETSNQSPAGKSPFPAASPRHLTPQQVGSPSPPQIAPKPRTVPTTSSEKLLTDAFGDIVLSPTKLDIDTNAILLSTSQSAEPEKKTVRREVSELGSDGKSVAVPAQQEHILYSNRMYLCTHVFVEPPAARAAETYLWAGSTVGDAAVEDAQIFARKAAKDAGGKLVIIRQGKEPASFFQALGGIVITRSGWSRDSSTSYMLCGRRHLGHLAFDEVQFSASSLCSGFVYIISTGQDQVFLWKGSGCNTEELAGARLLSMDAGPTGKVTEVEEGKEPKDLMALLASALDATAIPRSADHWKLKAKYENYRSRLFHVEYSERPLSRQDSGPAALWKFVRRGSQANMSASSGAQIGEVAPFAQSDLQSENIYVLDAFFEMYIIVGSAARLKPQAFSSALLFAQEYAALAATAENRPYVPVTTVVLEGVPRDLKRVFRTWNDSLMPHGERAESDGANRSTSMKVMPLSQALGALRSAGENIA